jgi:hypothetical protein
MNKDVVDWMEALWKAIIFGIIIGTITESLNWGSAAGLALFTVAKGLYDINRTLKEIKEKLH